VTLIGNTLSTLPDLKPGEQVLLTIGRHNVRVVRTSTFYFQVGEVKVHGKARAIRAVNEMIETLEEVNLGNQRQTDDSATVSAAAPTTEATGAVVTVGDDDGAL
jgi:hypothetical protein